jgi:hypothetical protein
VQIITVEDLLDGKAAQAAADATALLPGAAAGTRQRTTHVGRLWRR